MLRIGLIQANFATMPPMQPVDLVIVLLILFTLSIFLMMVTSIFLRAPYVPTPHKVVSKMISMADLQGNEVIYDLGAGDGRLLIAAKKKHPDITAKGFELSPPVYLAALIRIRQSKQDVSMQMKNFFPQDVSDADCVFLYLMPGAMKTLAKKFEKELKPGTKIVSHAFVFPDRKPIKSMKVPWLQGEKDLLLYEW